MQKKILWLIAILIAWTGHARAADRLAAGFASPPEQTKPWCYWYWLSDNISKEGITRDLEAMARVGIGEAFIGNIYLDGVPAGPVKAMSEEWWGLVAHAMREGARTGVHLGLFNCPGWSQSGGPWIKPEQSMRFLVSSELRVHGPQRFEGKLPVPHDSFQAVAVSAFPAPRADADGLAPWVPRVNCIPAVAEPSRLADGNLDTAVTMPSFGKEGPATFTIEIELAEAMTARSLQVVPGAAGFAARCELLAEQPDGRLVSVRKFAFDRANSQVNVGPMPRGAVAVSFAPVTAQRFRLVFSACSGLSEKSALAEIGLSGAARLEAYVEKQLGKMHPTPLPLWDAYLWRTQAEPDAANLVVPAAAVRDLSAQVAADGTLRWDVPPGDWIILNTGMAPTGVQNSPASPEGRGLEVDKMSRTLVRTHFDAFIGEVLRRVPAAERTAFTRVVADSYETGSENWSDGFAPLFEKRYGYDPRPWLPVLTGRLVGSADQSERFLWDLRRLVADRVASEYVGGLREASNAHGLGLWLENYGHWGFPGEFLSYGGASDRIGGEYWVGRNLGSIECRAASSAANTYGKPFVSAEAFTGGPAFENSPAALKARGDWSFCEGVNHLVLHVYIHQPWADDRLPGMNAWFGTEFNRNNTWFEQSRSWIDYLRRSCWLLQQGHRVADVAYFIGEDAPKMTGVREPALPPGYDFDYVNADVIEQRLTVRDGRLVLPHGAGYRVLVLPKLDTMRPAVLRKIRDLVKAGATVVGPAPTRSPSLAGFPRSDEEVQQLARELWGDSIAAAAGEHRLGRGRVVWGKGLAEILAAAGAPADIELQAAADARLLHTHRSAPDAEIYFVSNQSDRAESAVGRFRVAGRQPELWDAVTGERRDLTDWNVQDGRTAVPLQFGPRQSWFVIFRRTATPPVARAENFPVPVVKTTLAHDWEVSFDPARGGPAKVVLADLADWTTLADPAVKYYSGKAVYRRNFDWHPEAREAGARVWLDLGAVRDFAVVRLNGRELGTLWTAPWRVDVSAAIRPGQNELEIEVVNPWHNRLVGDSALPPEQRKTFLAVATVKADAPLLPAGLLGPVTLQLDARPPGAAP